MEIAATHNYRCRKEIYDEFRDQIPRSKKMLDIYALIFDSVISDDRFQKMILKSVEEDITERTPAYTWLYIKGFTEKKRREINRTLKNLLENARRGRPASAVSMTTLVTTAFRLISEGKYKLEF